MKPAIAISNTYHRCSEKAKKVLSVGNHIKAKHGILAYLKYRMTPIGSCQTQCKTCRFHYNVIANHDIRHCQKVMLIAKGTPYEFQIDQDKLDKIEKIKARVFTNSKGHTLVSARFGVQHASMCSTLWCAASCALKHQEKPF